MSAPHLQATDVEALPDVDGQTPGLWCVATQNATRYLILCHPEGANQAIRLSWYGLHSRWKPYSRSQVHTGERYPRNTEPVRVGEEMLIRFGWSIHDYYRSGPVVSIARYDMPDALRVDEIEDLARAAMLEAAAEVLAAAVRDDRFPDDTTLVEICAAGGVEHAEVLRRLP